MPDERRLRELAAIAQIYGQLQGPQQQQQNEQQRTALAVLGLMLQQQQQQAQREFQQQQLGQQQGEWQGQHQLAQQQLAGQESAQASTASHQAALEKIANQQLQQTGDTTQQKLMSDFVDRMMQRGDPLAQIQPFAESVGPKFTEGFKKSGEARTQEGVRRVLPQVQQAYKHPETVQKALETLWPSISQDVANALPWDQLNQSLPAPTAQVSGQGVGAALGGGIRNVVPGIAQGLQNADTAMTDFGSSFWASLLGFAPQPNVTPQPLPSGPVRPWGPFSR